MDVTAILMLRLVHRCLRGQKEASGGRMLGSPLRIESGWEARCGPVGAGLACPEWGCQCQCPRGVPQGVGALGWLLMSEWGWPIVADCHCAWRFEQGCLYGLSRSVSE